MRQILQSLRDGRTSLADVPVPRPSGRTIVVRTVASVVSAGTERMLVDFGKAGWIEKARSQPDKVRQVLQKVRSDGLGATLDAVRAKLDQPIPLGYCEAGIVAAVGSGVQGFVPGDRVVTNGPHAEYVRVPQTLVARIPDGVSFEAAAFSPLAAIGLQGLRLAQPTIGETIVVYGLGLIGLLTVQLARANGCRVLGIDRDANRLALAERFGATAIAATDGPSVVAQVMDLTGGDGADAVLLTLATDSDEPVHLAADMTRKRGRLVLVGVTGLKLSRDDFFKKELSLQVSCSYGPGRYDPQHEDQGIDYPLPYVRWTEGRNFAAVLQLMADGRVDPLPLVTHRLPMEQATRAYEIVGGAEPSLGIVLEYAQEPTDAAHEITLAPRPTLGRGTVGWVGAGSFSARVLIPAFKAANAVLDGIASAGGLSASIAGREHGFARVLADGQALIDDAAIDTLVIATRHDSHARWALRGLQANKHVFIEKPLALTLEDVDAIGDAARASGCHVCVGFNRRMAPLTLQLQDAIRGRGGAAITITVNAGALPRDHWTKDAEAGGGRIVGEACHFIDLARAIAGAPITRLHVMTAHSATGAPVDDVASIQLGFSNGAMAVIQYLANGNSAWPKERIEVFAGGAIAVIDNWRRLRVFGAPGSTGVMPKAQDKGHRAMAAAFMRAVRGEGPAPIALDELLEVSRWSVVAGDLARAGGGARMVGDAT